MAYPPGAASSAAGFGMLSTAAGAASSAASAAAAAAPSIFIRAIEAFRHATGWAVSRATIAGTTLAAWLGKPHMDTYKEFMHKLKAARHHPARIAHTVMRDEKYNSFQSLAAEMVGLSKETRRAMIHMLICLMNYETIYKNVNNPDPSKKTTDAQEEKQAELTLDAILIFLHLARQKNDRKVRLMQGLAATGMELTESNVNSETVDELGRTIRFPPHLADAINAFLQMHDEKLGPQEGQYPIHTGRTGGAAASTLPYLLDGTEEQTKQLYKEALKRIKDSFTRDESISSSELFRRIYGPTIDEGSSGSGAGMLVNSSAPAAAAAGAGAAAAGTGMLVNGPAPNRRIPNYFPSSSVGSKRRRPANSSASVLNAAPNAKRPRGEGEGEGEGQTGGSRRTRKHKRNHRLRSRTHKRRVTKSKHKSNRKTKTNRRH